MYWLRQAVLSMLIVLASANLVMGQDRPAPPPAAPPGSATPLIPAGADAYTQAKFENDVLFPFYTRMLVDAYKQHGERDSKWDADAIAFLEKMVKYEADAADAIWIDEAHEEARRLTDELGCSDPLIQYYFWRLRLAEWQMSSGTTPLLIGQRLAQRGYPVECLAAAYTLQIAYNHGWGDSEETPQLIAKACGYWFETFAAEQNRGEFQRAVWQMFLKLTVEAEKFGQSNKDDDLTPRWIELADRMIADESIDRWSAHLLRGQMEIERAWDYRGYGFADTVTPEGWKGFHKHIASADEHLRLAYQTNPKRPEAAAAMIVIAAVGDVPPDENLIFWFRRAVTAQMDYRPAYNAMRNYLRPRWGGSNELMLAMGMQCAATKRYDTLVPLFMSEYVDTLSQDVENKWEPLIKSGLVAEVVKVMQEMEKEPRWEGGRRQLYSRHAAFAFRLGDYAEANRVLRKMNQRPIDGMTRWANIETDVLIRIATARGGPSAGTVREGDSRFERHDYDGAAEFYQKALAELPGDDPGRRYLKDRIQAIEWSKAFAFGDWVDLTVDKHLTGWAITRGDWKRGPDGSLHGRATDNENPLILCDALFGHRFELEATLTFEAPIQKYWYNAGMVFCHAEKPLWRFRSALIHPKNSKFAVRRDFVYGDAVDLGVDIPLENRLRVLVYDRGSMFYVNDRLAHNAPWIREDEIFGDDERIGFGSRASLGRDPRYFKISSIRIRKLAEKPADME